jgi:RNA polymerase sigma factor (sigma-70 family)
MTTEQAIGYLNDKEFLDKLYGYAYKKCGNSYEAEDLCSNIVLELLRSVRNGNEIQSFYAFAWTIANRVYADFYERYKKNTSCFCTFGDDRDRTVNISVNPIEKYIESDYEKKLLRRVKREIAFLSKIYREVMIYYYLDEMKIPKSQRGFLFRIGC